MTVRLTTPTNRCAIVSKCAFRNSKCSNGTPGENGTCNYGID